jgi:Na+-driven multidrug efflux pump
LIDWMLDLVGATGETHRIAAGYMWITLPTTPLLGATMCLIGILRSAGDAKRSMYSTLVLGLTTAILDPILIYGLGYGVTGAAIVTVIARVLTVAYGLTVAIKVHGLIVKPTVKATTADFMPLARIGGPAVLTNIATPVGNGIVTAQVAVFGDYAVAGWTIVARLIPVAFGVLFALPGAIGPIVGQNFGAGEFGRIRRTIVDSMIVTAVYTSIVSLVLFIGRDAIVGFFGASGDDARLVLFFCQYLAMTYVFGGGIFVSVAAFNNLGYPMRATLFNWARATIGTIPFVWVGAHLGGAEGALAGFAIGAIPFGILALFVANRTINRLADERKPAEQEALRQAAE